MNEDPDKSLATLTQLRVVKERDAARRLREARARLDQERRNLTTVQQYLAEYTNSGIENGSKSRVLADGQRFLLNLERTVEAQRTAVENARRQAETARTHWAAARSEREAMSRLLERRRDAQTRVEIEREQRQSDEQAIRRNGKQTTGQGVS